MQHCPFCQQNSFEWVERDKSGWCILCGYYQYFPNFRAFIAGEDGEELVGR